MVLDIARILQILPHRYPFLLVDRILSLEENRVVGLKNVTINEPFFQGHFPGHPIMPGVLLLEAMAQVGACLAVQHVEDPSKVLFYFVGIDKARFRRPVRPGDQVIFELELLSLRRRLCTMAGKALVDGERACEAELIAAIVDREA
ncbi:MAG: 3-hydroxyacyl-ACP dehydratase FabZ [Bacteroidetes bacterium]|nr:3-hydroxyacyl-ACP dehydratase FabZ [Rhodothermia bacterium]MCS7154737.1 3-hydroxyacyl-ACP dehydratase FabZ [Bacteroidota bacterium]MCX7907106.1 3-hydroxyacyl-ACP dehydratase FabZ [Bacteroidota bacterium]